MKRDVDIIGFGGMGIGVEIAETVVGAAEYRHAKARHGAFRQTARGPPVLSRRGLGVHAHNAQRAADAVHGRAPQGDAGELGEQRTLLHAGQGREPRYGVGVTEVRASLENN